MEHWTFNGRCRGKHCAEHSAAVRPGGVARQVAHLGLKPDPTGQADFVAPADAVHDPPHQ